MPLWITALIRLSAFQADSIGTLSQSEKSSKNHGRVVDDWLSFTKRTGPAQIGSGQATVSQHHRHAPLRRHPEHASELASASSQRVSPAARRGRKRYPTASRGNRPRWRVCLRPNGPRIVARQGWQRSGVLPVCARSVSTLDCRRIALAQGKPNSHSPFAFRVARTGDDDPDGLPRSLGVCPTGLAGAG